MKRIWVAQWLDFRGRCHVRVFFDLTDCDAFRGKMWMRGIDPEYWEL